MLGFMLGDFASWREIKNYYNREIMLKNTFIIAWRNLIRNKRFTILNLLGLTMGITAFIMISLYIIQELSYDRFYADADRVYRVTTHWQGAENTNVYATTPPPLGPFIQLEVPEIEGVTRLFKFSDFTLRPETDLENVFRESEVYATDSTYNKVLDNGWIAGDPKTAFIEPYSFVLPKTTAIKYFGEEAYERNQILGKHLLIGKDGGTPAKVTGIIHDQPENSHLQFEMLISMSTYNDMPDLDNWSWAIMHTYLKLRDHSDKAAVEERLAGIIKKHAVPYIQSDPHAFTTGDSFLEFHLQPLTDIYLHSDMLREMRANGNILYVYLFIGISLFIILIASVNFMNLSTAQAGKRAREVGVRKMFGAHRSGLMGQFLMESMLFVFLAGAISLMLSEILQQPFQTLTGASLTISIWESPELLGGLFLALFVIGLLAGSYPAFYLTSFQPIQSLKQVLVKGAKASVLRNGLVVFQFAISIGMIIATLGVIQQIQYIQNKNLGFDKDQVLVIQNDREIGESEERAGFRARLIQENGIEEVAFSTGIPALKDFHMRDLRREAALDGIGINWYQADEYFQQTMDLKMADGRWFSKSYGTDSSGIILNQAAITVLGIDNPVGSYLTLNKGANDEARLKVLGVVEDFHFESFSSEIKPLAIQHLHNDIFKDYITIRLTDGDIAEQVSTIEGVWKEFEPNVPFNYSFLDERFDQLFRSEQNLGKIFSLFTGLAIFIACLGLLGLASYTTEKRAREIGIRKVLGASVSNILYMLSKEYIRLVIIALLVAIPITWIGMDHWLSGFAYKAPFEVWTFFAAGFVGLMIAVLTVSGQSYKAASSDPMEVLRDE